MTVSIEEAIETQQLMSNDGEEDEPKISESVTTTVIENKTSNGAASVTSNSKHIGQTVTSTSSTNESSKVTYVNERRLHRDLFRSNYNNRPKNILKDTPDVKHMEKALLELLNDFQCGKLSAFGPGCSMEQMINIRDQQEHLARLHFRLCADVERPSNEDFDNSSSRDKMAQLVQNLEQLSTSIENLHSDCDINVNT